MSFTLAKTENIVRCAERAQVRRKAKAEAERERKGEEGAVRLQIMLLISFILLVGTYCA